MREVIRIWIGTEPKTEIARKVLEHSIRARTKARVEFTPMIGPAWEYSLAGLKVGTGFSLRRWMIPAACDWQGRAIYMDADQLVLGDVAELWAAPDADYSAGAAVWCSYQPDKVRATPWPQTSVMVLDCAAARGKWGFEIDKALFHLRKRNVKIDYHNFMHATWLEPAPVRTTAHWNALNVYEPGKTKLLHYTKEPEQPHYCPDHPLAWLWQKELEATILAGGVSREEFVEALSRWGKKEDWRSTNGIHPYYRKFLPLFDDARAG